MDLLSYFLFGSLRAGDQTLLISVRILCRLIGIQFCIVYRKHMCIACIVEEIVIDNLQKWLLFQEFEPLAMISEGKKIKLNFLRQKLTV